MRSRSWLEILLLLAVLIVLVAYSYFTGGGVPTMKGINISGRISP